MTETLTLRRPDDWHMHLRDGAMLKAVANHTARQFTRAIVMPNLVPPVTTAAIAAMAEAYRVRILAAVEPGLDLTPLMTAYLTDTIDPDQARPRPSRRGVHRRQALPRRRHHQLRRWRHRRGPHLPGAGAPAGHRHATPGARRGSESCHRHLRSRGGRVRRERARQRGGHHHRPASGDQPQPPAGRRCAPHLYSLPVAKRQQHRLALRQAATSGSPKFFLGTDTAPHPRPDKETACDCADIFSAPVALVCYAATFEAEGALDRLEAFASLNGPRF